MRDGWTANGQGQTFEKTVFIERRDTAFHALTCVPYCDTHNRAMELFCWLFVVEKWQKELTLRTQWLGRSVLAVLYIFIYLFSLSDEYYFSEFIDDSDDVTPFDLPCDSSSGASSMLFDYSE